MKKEIQKQIESQEFVYFVTCIGTAMVKTYDHDKKEVGMKEDYDHRSRCWGIKMLRLLKKQSCVGELGKIFNRVQ